MTSTVRPKFIETATEVKQSAATSGKALNLDGDLKLTNNAIFRYNAGFIEFSFDAGTSWYQIGEKLKEWASAKAYYIGDIVIYLDKIYRCDVANSDVSFVDANWTAIGGGSGGGGSAQTGLLTGGEVTIGADNTSVDVTALVGRIVDDYTDPLNPVVYDVTADASNVPITNVATAGVTYLYVDKTGAFVQSLTQLSSSQMREHFLLGAVIHTTGGVANAVNNVTEGVTNGLGLAFLDLQRYQGPKNYEGNVFTPNGTNPLGFNKTAGKILFFGGNYKIDRKNPNISNTTELTNPNFFLTWRNGTGGNWSNLVTQSINPAQYDLNGVLTNVGNNKWKADRVFLVQSGIVVQYAQNIYASRAETVAAIRSEQFTLNPDLSQNALFIGWLLTSGSDTAWLSSNLILSESGMAGASPALVLNSWGVTHVDASMSPYTVLNPRQYVLVDASAGAVTIKLENVSSGTADRETRIYCTSNSNPVTVTTVGGSQLIGGSTTQKILQENEGFSVVADFSDLKYVITQDNRKESSFKYAQGVWAYFKNYPDIDTANSNLVGGFAVSGNNHYVTVTTGTTAGAYFVSNAVFTEDIIKDINYFSFLYSTASSLGFKAIIQGFNGSTWSDVSSADLPTGDKATYPLQFSLSTYAAFRFKVVQNGTTAGLTCTIARGEWTDDYWKSVQIPNSVDTEWASYTPTFTSFGTVSGVDIQWRRVGTNLELRGRFTAGTVVTAEARMSLPSDLVSLSTLPALSKVGDIAVSYAETATLHTLIEPAVPYITFGKQSAGAAGYNKANGNSFTSNGSITLLASVPIQGWAANSTTGKQGIVAAAEVDLSQYQYPSYDQTQVAITGAASVRYAKFIYKETSNGKHFLYINASLTHASAASQTVSIAGVLFVDNGDPKGQQLERTFLNSSNNEQIPYRASCTPNSNTVTLLSTGVFTQSVISGWVEISAKPSWATQPTIKPATIIAPVAVAKRQYVTMTGLTWESGYIDSSTTTTTSNDCATVTHTVSGIDFVAQCDGTMNVTGSILSVANNFEAFYIYENGTTIFQAIETRGSNAIHHYQVSAEVPIIKGRAYRFGASVQITSGQLYVSFSALDTAHIATNKEEIHKHATYLSSTETEAGWSVNRNKQIYKRTIYFPSDVTASNTNIVSLGTTITPSKAIKYYVDGSNQRWQIESVTASGANTANVIVYYNKVTGNIGVDIGSGYGVYAGTELEFFYTKD